MLSEELNQLQQHQRQERQDCQQGHESTTVSREVVYSFVCELDFASEKVESL